MIPPFGALARRERSGQIMPEFTLAFMIFAALTLGAIDVSRAMFNKHGLSRAAEAVAHGVVVQYAADSAPVTSQSAVSILQSAQTASDVGFSTAAPTTVTNSSLGYQELSNGSVYICGSPSLTQPQVIKVTVKGTFRPASSLFIGGRSLGLAESDTALTYLGEQAGTSYQTPCPDH